MKIFLCPNFQREQAINGTKKIIDTLLSLSLTPILTVENAKQLGGDNITACLVYEHRHALQKADIIMPIGGDGTVLHEALHALEAEKPVLGVNAGRLGFLSQLELSELPYLARLRDGNYTISKRMLLQLEVVRNGISCYHTALNDIVISRPEANQILDISVYDTLGERLILRQRADGIIFATPTGSTAYSYSAGGPVVSPEMEAILLTAIAPHTAFRNALVLPVTEKYMVAERHVNEPTGFIISADGRVVDTIAPNEKTGVIVRKSNRAVDFIDLGLRDFYKNLNDKLVTL